MRKQVAAAVISVLVAAMGCSGQKPAPLVYIECTRQFDVFENNYLIDESKKLVLDASTKKPLGTVTKWDDVLIEVKTEPIKAGLKGDPPRALIYHFGRMTGSFSYRVEGVNDKDISIGTCEQKPLPEKKF